MSYYTVGNPTTTYYTTSIFGIKTWKKLSDQGVRLWSALKALNLITWKQLADAKNVTMYYMPPDVTTTYYEVSV